MISRIYFTIDGKEYECNVRQPYGESFSFEKDPIEVEAPDEIKKIINYGQFRDEVENYFRKAVGPNQAEYELKAERILECEIIQ